MFLSVLYIRMRSCEKGIAKIVCSVSWCFFFKLSLVSDYYLFCTVYVSLTSLRNFRRNFSRDIVMCTFHAIIVRLIAILEPILAKLYLCVTLFTGDTLLRVGLPCEKLNDKLILSSDLRLVLSLLSIT